jgi:hypothetical protein
MHTDACSARKMDRKLIIQIALMLIVAAYASYLFHEFGHWLVGTLLGNEMSMRLNGAWPTSGIYLKESHSLPVGIGGPAFTILQAFIVLVIIEKYKTLLAYPFLMFPLVFRVFSLALGEFGAQDEAGISATLGLGKYTAVIIVCSILLGLVWRGSRTLKLNGLVIIRFMGGCSVSMLMVIATHKLLFS